MSFEQECEEHASMYDETPAEEEQLANGEYQFEIIDTDFGSYTKEGKQIPRVITKFRFRTGDYENQVIETMSSFASQASIRMFKQLYLTPLGIDPATPFNELEAKITELNGTYVAGYYKSVPKKNGPGFYHNVNIKSVEGRNENAPQY